MIPKKVKFSFEKRTVGIPYVLWASIDGCERWAVMEWEKIPKEQTIEDTKNIFGRSCEIYHRHIGFPRFQMKEV